MCKTRKNLLEKAGLQRKNKTKGKWAMRDKTLWTWGRYCDRRGRQHLTSQPVCLWYLTPFQGWVLVLATLYALEFYDNPFSWVCLEVSVTCNSKNPEWNNHLILILKTWVWVGQETRPKFHSRQATYSVFTFGPFLYSMMFQYIFYFQTTVQ